MRKLRKDALEQPFSSGRPFLVNFLKDHDDLEGKGEEGRRGEGRRSERRGGERRGEERS